MSVPKLTAIEASHLLEGIAKLQRCLTSLDTWRIKEALDELIVKYDKLQEEYVATNDALMEEVIKRQNLESGKTYWKQYPEHKPKETGYYLIKQQPKLDATDAVQCYFWNDSEAFSWETVYWWCEIPDKRMFISGEDLCRRAK